MVLGVWEAPRALRIWVGGFLENPTLKRRSWREAIRPSAGAKRASARLMAAQGMTQVQIADELGVTDRTVRAWLND